MQNNKVQNKKVIRKPGRTLVVKSEQPISSDGFVGLVNTAQTTNNSHFFVFDNIENSKTAFKILKDASHKVRFAHYRIFFTMNGVDDTITYNDLKTQHINWIISNSGADVLYYKQYRKDNKFLGCGDFTIDTKESMDKLLDKDGLKNYTFENYSGTFYRYNKKNDQDDRGMNSRSMHDVMV
jgi:hypothetical protein